MRRMDFMTCSPGCDYYNGFGGNHVRTNEINSPSHSCPHVPGHLCVPLLPMIISGVVRIPKDRDHQVVSTGPYRFICHSGYAGALRAYLAMSL
jgi:hypothetical protein